MAKKKAKTRRKTNRTKRKQKWVQEAIENPGAFHAWCIAHGFKKANKSCIEEARRIAKKTGNTTLLRRANLAETLLKLQKKRRTKRRRK